MTPNKQTLVIDIYSLISKFNVILITKRFLTGLFPDKHSLRLAVQTLRRSVNAFYQNKLISPDTISILKFRTFLCFLKTLYIWCVIRSGYWTWSYVSLNRIKLTTNVINNDYDVFVFTYCYLTPLAIIFIIKTVVPNIFVHISVVFPVDSSAGEIVLISFHFHDF